MLIRPCFIAIVSALFVSCSGGGSTFVERLDPATGVTVTVIPAPLIFFRDSSSRAAYARDFVNVGPVQVNRMGQHRYFLWLGIWSTLPDPDATTGSARFDTVTVFADGEPLPLEFIGWTADAIGVSSHPYSKPVASARDGYYEATADQLRLIAEAESIRLLAGATDVASYELWGDQRAARRSMTAFFH